MIISNANKSNLPNILQLQYAAYQSEAEIYQEIIPPLKQSLSELEDGFNKGIFLKAVIGEMFVASVRAVKRSVG
ncbi:hypothetical protein [Paenibacillus sp. YIM B09110]|uniref:hypothetical protein n=1 Tax=Paenibacillus sp. YIM B09110 TaxID=3126102 RepID=UPI00301E02C1